MQPTDGLVIGGPVHSDDPGPMTPTPQANGGVTPKLTSYSMGNSNEGIEGGINNKGSGTHGPRFSK